MKKIILLLTGLIALNFQNQAQTVSDIDGNSYNIVTIGTQMWMKENLRVTKYNDGIAIPLVTNTTWGILSTPAYCNYNNTLNLDTINIYGRLYNWYSVNTNKLCPIGWHVPSNTEWSTLTTYLGGETVAGGKLKGKDTTYWKSPNTEATNETGFGALPSGNRYYSGTFTGIGLNCYLWTSTTNSSSTAYYRRITNNQGSVYKDVLSKILGFSVRCLSDTLYTQIKEKDLGIQFEVYPNPATGRITINCTEKENNLYIYNLLGELVFQQQLSSRINEIYISNLQTGIYLIKIENEQGTWQQKLIK